MKRPLTISSLFAISVLCAACSSPDPATTGSGGNGGAGGNATSSGSGSTSSGSNGSSSSGGNPAPVCMPACTSGSVCVDGVCSSSPSGIGLLDKLLLEKQADYDAQLMISQLPDMSWVPSTIYRWGDFLQALYPMHLVGVGDKKFYFGELSDDEMIRMKIGAVNIAAFIAQSMVETIQYDACDENNWDTGYPITSACGQLGQNYENYDCAHACPKNPNMQMSALTNAKWYGAPGPLFCAPNAVLEAAGLGQGGKTGYWNHSSDCWPYPATEPNFTPADGPAYSRPECQVYAGQKGGKWVWDGSAGSVEGCCWWGRGVIQTTGRCNFGLLNHYLGKTHIDPSVEPQPAKVLYPDVDFCADPEVVCASKEHPELKWVAGLFYWMSSVQTYDKDGWNYIAQLRAFVTGGLTDPNFIHSVSGIVNRGCHNPPCGTGELHNGPLRAANFQKVLKVMGLVP